MFLVDWEQTKNPNVILPNSIHSLLILALATIISIHNTWAKGKLKTYGENLMQFIEFALYLMQMPRNTLEPQHQGYNL